MAATFSHPFRLRRNGQVATVDSDSDAGIAEALALVCLTKRGERKLAPSFGITDPAFRPIEPTEIAAAVALHGPPVRISNVRQRALSPTVVEISLEYSSTSEGPIVSIS